MAIFNAMNYANSDAYIKSNLLYMNLFTGKSESHFSDEDNETFLANMTIYLSECKNIVSSLKNNLESDNRIPESITEDMIKYFMVDSNSHSFLSLNPYDSTVFFALRKFADSLNDGDVLFTSETEDLIDYASLNLDKDTLHTMKEKINCIKSCIPCKNFNDEDKYNVIKDDLKKERLIEEVKKSRKSLIFLRDELHNGISDTCKFIDKLLKRYNELSNEELMKFRLSAIYVNITLGMQIKILTNALDRYFNYIRLYNTRFDILKGECD